MGRRFDDAKPGDTVIIVPAITAGEFDPPYEATIKRVSKSSFTTDNGKRWTKYGTLWGARNIGWAAINNDQTICEECQRPDRVQISAITELRRELWQKLRCSLLRHEVRQETLRLNDHLTETECELILAVLRGAKARENRNA